MLRIVLWTRAGSEPLELVQVASAATISCASKAGDRAMEALHMSWTDERVEQLKSLWTEGLSASQIARALGGVTRNAVIGKVHRLGLAGRATPTRSDRPRVPSAPKAST